MNQQSYLKSLLKTIAVLASVVCILVLCLLITISSAFSIWIHTYKAFTQRHLVAEIIVSQKQEKNGIPFSEITYKETQSKSAFERIFYRDAMLENTFKEPQNFTIYGDSFEISADTIKWNDWATLLGFDTVYKVTRISGEYRDIDMERTAKRSVYDLNGGTDSTWLTLEENQEKLSLVVDAIYTSSASTSFQDKEYVWNLYVTEDGLYLDRT